MSISLVPSFLLLSSRCPSAKSGSPSFTDWVLRELFTVENVLGAPVLGGFRFGGDLKSQCTRFFTGNKHPRRSNSP